MFMFIVVRCNDVTIFLFLGMCSVFLPDEDRTVNITADHLQPVQPVRGDKVKVIMGKVFLLVTMGL
jgi:hypothetical protein